MYQINKRQNQLHLRPRFFVGRLEPVCLCTRGPLAYVQRAGVSVRLRVSIFYVAAISERPGGIIFRGDRRLYASSRPPPLPPPPPFPLSPPLAAAAVPATARLCHIGRHAPIEKTQRNTHKKKNVPETRQEFTRNDDQNLPKTRNKNSSVGGGRDKRIDKIIDAEDENYGKTEEGTRVW